MTEYNTTQHQDARNTYSIISRRFTELTSGWTHYSSVGALEVLRHSQPQGTVTEVQIIAVPYAADTGRHGFDYVRPTTFKCTADAVVQRDLDSKQKVDIELWQNGFVDNNEFPNCGRMCFAQHAAESSHVYSGGYNMSIASNVDFEFSFAEAVNYRIFAVQLQRIKIDGTGRYSSYL